MRIRVLLIVVFLLGGCAAAPAAVPRPVPSVTVLPSGVTFAPPVSATGTEPCNPRESYRPLGPPGAIPPGSTMARIKDQGRLILGIGSSAYLLSHRDPYDGKVKGFEAEIAREIAAAIFDGDREKIQFRALNAAERIPAVRAKDDNTSSLAPVDMVMAAMTMTCDRWAQVAFSTEYYSAGQKVLVNKRSGIKSTADLAGKKVCASATSTNIKTIAEMPAKPMPVAAANTSDCLVMLQQGQIDAVSTGDVILAGLAAQDEATEILPERFTDEPTGIAMSVKAPDLVRFVNGVLENLKTSGRWQQLQNDFLQRYIGDAKPPVAQYKPE